ncbi:MAG TPA: hypothetical protein PLN69_11030 [bacterium]|nr:hypothetical protein [bacterium]
MGHSCSETMNPLLVPPPGTLGRVAASDSFIDISVVIPVPPEIIEVGDKKVPVGREFFVSAMFHRQKKMNGLELQMIAPQEGFIEKRKVHLFLNEIGSNNKLLNRTRYAMTCESKCSEENSMWKLTIPFYDLPQAGTDVGYFVVIEDEYGNVATEVPYVLDQTGEASQWIWKYYDENDYTTPPLQSGSVFTLLDSVDSLKPKADITGLRALVSKDKISVEMSFAGNPDRSFNDDNSLYFYSLNIFSSSANRGDTFDGVGQMIQNATLPKISDYTDCGILISASPGDCYMSNDADSLMFSPNCMVDGSHSFATQHMSVDYYENRLAFQFDKSLYEEVVQELFPDTTGYVTLVMTVPAIDELSPYQSWYAALYDISNGMNLYPRTHSFVTTEPEYEPALIHIDAGWNLLFISDTCIPRGTEEETEPGYLPFVFSNREYRRMEFEYNTLESLHGMWYLSDHETSMAYDCYSERTQNSIYIPVFEGWNIIGHNLLTDVEFDNDHVSVLVNNTQLPIDQAIADGIIDGTMFNYKDGEYGLVAYGDVLESGRGYFIKADIPCTVEISLK